MPDRLAFKPHSCTVPFRLTSNRSIESDPAIGIYDYQNIVAPARFRYSTSGFTGSYRKPPNAAHHNEARQNYHRLQEVFCIWHTVGVAWEVEFTDEFRNWWETLSEEQQDDVAHSVRHLIEFGPALGFPHSSKVGSSRYPQMRELRTQSAGRPLRTLYAFNPLRSAILLIGGEKTGDDRWYEKFVPIADRLFQRHLLEIRKEGNV